MKKGAVDFLEILSKKYDLKLFTSRNKNLVEKWVFNNGLDKYFSGITNIKEVCWLFVDDRCITFNGNYDDLLNEIVNFKVWHENKVH